MKTLIFKDFLMMCYFRMFCSFFIFTIQRIMHLIKLLINTDAVTNFNGMIRIKVVEFIKT